MSDALLRRKSTFNDDPTDDFPYDVKVDMPLTGKLDILYTSDIHAGWNNFGGSRWGTKTFSLDHDSLTSGSPYYAGGDLKKYKERLIASGRPTYILDCGDATNSKFIEGHVTRPLDTSYLPNGYSSWTNDALCRHTIDMMNAVGYLGTTTGNWEWKRDNINTAFSWAGSVNNMMACNVYNVSSGVRSIRWTGTTSNALSYIRNKGWSHIVPGFKTMKVGNKKICFIAVGYPSPNGQETYGEYDEDYVAEHESVGYTGIEKNTGTFRWNYKRYDGGSTHTSLFTWNDSSKDSSVQNSGTVTYNQGGCLYRDVQYIINALKYGFGFDYVIVFCHLDKFTDENYSADNRFYSRADFLIKNTNGIDILIPGHWNHPKNTSAVSWRTSIPSGYTDGITSYPSGSGIIAYETAGEMNTIGRLEIDLVSDTVKNRLLYNTSHLEATDIDNIPIPPSSLWEDWEQ